MGELAGVAVLEINGGGRDGADIVFDFNDQRIAVSVFPNSSASDRKQFSIQDHLINLLGCAVSVDVDDEECEELHDEILIIIMDAGRSVFNTQATSNLRSDLKKTLHSALYPTILHFQLVDICGKAVIIPIKPSGAYTLSAGDKGYVSAEEEDLGVETTLPCHSTKAISVLEMFTKGSEYAACRVLVDGKEMFCKADGCADGLIGTGVGRELEILPKIRNAALRVPPLLAYVRHADTNRVVGFLRQWVPGGCLMDVDIPATAIQRRRKWFLQIREAVHTLHARGMIRGDGNASNFIIDEHDDAWLIGWARGWRNKESAAKADGDIPALGKMAEFLGVGQDGKL